MAYTALMRRWRSPPTLYSALPPSDTARSQATRRFAVDELLLIRLSQVRLGSALHHRHPRLHGFHGIHGSGHLWRSPPTLYSALPPSDTARSQATRRFAVDERLAIGTGLASAARGSFANPSLAGTIGFCFAPSSPSATRCKAEPNRTCERRISKRTTCGRGKPGFRERTFGTPSSPSATRVSWHTRLWPSSQTVLRPRRPRHPPSSYLRETD
jgi:hypothetical protein